MMTHQHLLSSTLTPPSFSLDGPHIYRFFTPSCSEAAARRAVSIINHRQSSANPYTITRCRTIYLPINRNPSSRTLSGVVLRIPFLIRDNVIPASFIFSCIKSVREMWTRWLSLITLSVITSHIFWLLRFRKLVTIHLPIGKAVYVTDPQSHTCLSTKILDLNSYISDGELWEVYLHEKIHFQWWFGENSLFHSQNWGKC